MIRPILLLAVASLPWLGCASGSGPSVGSGAAVTAVEVSGTEVGSDLQGDAEVEALVAPFRGEMQERTREVIGEASGRLDKGGEWESTLGNFSADAMLHTANRLVSSRVQVAISNGGGLRVPIPPGPITLGLMYELMPFENTLVVQTFKGVHLRALAEEIVRVGGEPVAGLRIGVDDRGEVAGITVEGAPLDPAGEYRVVTSDYLANGSGDLPTLWDPVAREDLGVTLRDAFIRYVRASGEVVPTLDGRIGWVRP